MSTRKYSVTIEDWPEDEVMSSQTGADQPHLYQYGETSVYDHSPSDGEKESWSHMNTLEEQARREKIQDASIAKRNAHKVAHIVEEGEQRTE
ncbi:hypothetical protein [Absidia glauca]|uniref:Uncharacterized protein n=1 Tax=Absidia glauca TaxID=4829 RepID=A0A163J8U0_ABSGL|nr:hypothetical protein [Absidia glauca]